MLVQTNIMDKLLTLIFRVGLYGPFHLKTRPIHPFVVLKHANKL